MNKKIIKKAFDDEVAFAKCQEKRCRVLLDKVKMQRQQNRSKASANMDFDALFNDFFSSANVKNLHQCSATKCKNLLIAMITSMIANYEQECKVQGNALSCDKFKEMAALTLTPENYHELLKIIAKGRYSALF